MWTWNVTQTFVEKYDPWSGILAAAAFAIVSKTIELKGYSPGQLVFGYDMIPLIKHKVDWELIRQPKQKQINKDDISKNRNRVEHDYIVGSNVMLNNHSV